MVLVVSLIFLQGMISEAHFSNLSNLSKLWTLYLSSNSLALEFNFNWVPPFQLDQIQLSSCNLGPRFPNWIRTQRNISVLDISNAEISDTIPAEWFANLPPTPILLNLSRNQIHGGLPNVSTNFLNALVIDLSDNRLEGPLPLFPTALTILNLARNRFLGSVSFVCKITDDILWYIDLSNNLLSGRLPNCFSYWSQLYILNFANNNFFGEVPNSLGKLHELETLNLHNNTLNGELPSLKNCKLLKFVDLGDNRFSGKVPAWIGEGLPQLIVLILRSNKFVGSIPLQLCHLIYLRILDLSMSDISGAIPQYLNNLTAMAEKGNDS